MVGDPSRGAGRGPGQRRPRPSGGLLPRLDGDDAVAGDGLRTALRARHFPAENSQRLAGGAAGQLAAPSRSVGGRAPRRERRGDVRLLVRIARGHAAHDPEQPLDADRRPLRPAGGRLRRQDGQYASAVERHGRACVRLSAVQRRRLRRLDRRSAQRRIADPRSLSRRSHAPGARAAAHAGIFPRRLFAGRYRSQVPRDRIRIGGRCPTRRPSR